VTIEKKHGLAGAPITVPPPQPLACEAPARLLNLPEAGARAAKRKKVSGRMRVLVALLSVNFYGTERHAIELANALSAEHEVALVLRRRPSAPHRQLGYDTLLAAVAPGVKLFAAGRALPLIGLARAVRAFRPEVIHTHYERSARWATRLPFGVPVIATNHYGYRDDYARCAGLICLTQAQLAGVPPGFRGRVFHIGNWVLPHPAPSPERVRELRAGLGIGAEEFVVGSVARLDPEKGFSGLIEAFSRAGLHGARLVIVGTGALEAELRAQAAPAGDRILFAGFRPDVRDLYRAFDVFVLNSTVEQFVLVVLEALEAGLPVIATASDGVREIAARSPLHLIPVGDTDALVAALRDARAGRIAVAPDGAGPFRLAAVLPRIVAAYEAVAGARRGAEAGRAALPVDDHAAR
jgi:glycosyltransferase involved in cell wall biosynthesis